MKACKLVTLFIVALLVTVFFVGCVTVPVVAGSTTGTSSPAITPADPVQPGWMLHADERHSGVYDDGGTRPTNQIKWQFGDAYTQQMGDSPVIANGMVYFNDRGGQVRVLYANNGTLKWQFGTASVGGSQSSVAVADGVVFAYTLSDVGYSLTALNADTGAVIWRAPGLGWSMGSPAVVNGIVYTGDANGNVYAVDASSGSTVWEATLPYNGPTTSPAVANGVVYVGNYASDSAFYALSAADGHIIWQQPINGLEGGDGSMNSATVADGRVFFATTHAIVSFDAATGGSPWLFAPGVTSSTVGYYFLSSILGYNFDSPVVSNGVVYVGSWEGLPPPYPTAVPGALFAIDATTGTQIWKLDLGTIQRAPSLANGVLYVPVSQPIGGGNAELLALDAASANPLWEFTFPSGVVAPPTVANGTVYVTSSNACYAFGPPNQPPVANAGPDQTVAVNTKATLDGTASSDPDNNLPLTYPWSIQTAPAGSTAQLSSATADKPTFTPDKPGDYVFALTVKDSLGLQSTTADTVKITAKALPTVTVRIDIDPTLILPKTSEIVAVTIESNKTNGFDPLTVVPSTVKFGHSGTEASIVGVPLKSHDDNHDGMKDLTLFFRAKDTGLVPTDRQAILAGKTVSGTQIQGSAKVVVVV